MGCGQGAASLFLTREGFDVTAVDGSHSALQKLADRLTKENLPGECVCTDITNTYFPEASFDGLVDIVALAHNENPYDIAKEMHRVLRPEGKLFSVIPTSECWRTPFLNKGAIQFLTHDEVHDLYARWFTLQVGWVKELLHTGDVLEHWVISGIKR